MTNAIAFFGDIHGHHDRMVSAVHEWQRNAGVQIDLIVCCGDFEALRDEVDLQSVAGPEKYRRMGDYGAYHRGEKAFPTEVIFIGGNHEAYNCLDEVPAGGVVGPRCYYLGRQGVVCRFGLRIAGLTGNYSAKAYSLGRRRIDFADPAVIRSRKARKKATYFVREEVEALAQSGPVDVLLLHDWPAGLPDLADPATVEGTPRRVGSEPAQELLEAVRPRWLFCGHMHWYFRGDIPWPDGTLTTFVCLDKIDRPRGPFMAVLRGAAGSDWELECVPLDEG